VHVRQLQLQLRQVPGQGGGWAERGGGRDLHRLVDGRGRRVARVNPTMYVKITGTFVQVSALARIRSLPCLPCMPSLPCLPTTLSCLACLPSRMALTHQYHTPPTPAHHSVPAAGRPGVSDNSLKCAPFNSIVMHVINAVVERDNPPAVPYLRPHVPVVAGNVGGSAPARDVMRSGLRMSVAGRALDGGPTVHSLVMKADTPVRLGRGTGPPASLRPIHWVLLAMSRIQACIPESYGQRLHNATPCAHSACVCHGAS
jgi:hypothetical protein